MNAVCLKCRRELPSFGKEESGEYLCPCGTAIPYKFGILQFVEEDPFYEGKFTETRQTRNALERLVFVVLRLISIDGNEERMWSKGKKYILRNTNSRPLQILNIGAGGGHAFLSELGSVTAIDLSLGSLQNAQSIYDSCYQADAREMPFPDDSFDLVFSAHLLGHIPLEFKQEVIREIYRVTKPGGYSLHSAECEADNLVYKKAKRHPALYKKYFEDMYGHYGLEKPSLCKKRFRDEGFEPIFEYSDYCKGVVRPANSYKVFFGEREYREKDWFFRFLYWSSHLASWNTPVRLFSGVLLYPFTVLNRLGGPDSVDSVKLLYRKN